MLKSIIIMLTALVATVQAKELKTVTPAAEFCDISGGINLSNDPVKKTQSAFRAVLEVKLTKPGTIKLLSGNLMITSLSVTQKDLGWFQSEPLKKLRFHEKAWHLHLDRTGTFIIHMTFNVAVEADKDEEKCSFQILPSVVSRLQNLNFNRPVDLKIPGAINLTEKTIVLSSFRFKPESTPKTLPQLRSYSAVLPGSGKYSFEWQRKSAAAQAALSISTESVVQAMVRSGAIKFNDTLEFKILQGKAAGFRIRLPDGFNVLEVKGENIQTWNVEKIKDSHTLIMTLSQPVEKSYALKLVGEKILDKFPSEFMLSAPTVEGALQMNGVLLVNNAPGVKTTVTAISGFNQLAPRSIGRICNIKMTVPMPAYAFAFGANRGEVKIKAENVKPVYSVREVGVVEYNGENAVFNVSCELDIRDAPLRELLISYAPTLAFNSLSGRHTAPDSYELFQRDGKKYLKVIFSSATMGSSSFKLSFEQKAKAGTNAELPRIEIEGARDVRGCLVLAAAEGLKLETADLQGLRRIPVGSAPIRVTGSISAMLFKDESWQGKVKISRIKGSIVSEVFHLASVGDGSVYGSSLFSYHIAGAPAERLRFRVSDKLRNLEFRGAEIIDWKKLKKLEKGFSEWELHLRRKYIGELNLLAAYEIPLPSGQGEISVGVIDTINADSENGFIAIASGRNISVTPGKLPEQTAVIEQIELPSEYRAMVSNPLLKTFRCVKRPHTTPIVISGYKQAQPPVSVIDFTELKTSIDNNGEAVTEATCRVKNVNGQFMAVTLPQSSKLWSVSVDGKRKRLSMDNGKLLIPLPRHLNINHPIAVSIVYSQQVPELKRRADFKLVAPVTEAQSMMRRWNISVPDGCTIISASEEAKSGSFSLNDFLRSVERHFGKALFAGVMLVGSFLLLIAAFHYLGSGRKTPGILFFVIGVGFGIPGLLAAGSFVMNLSLPLTRQMEFVKLFSLGSEPFQINMTVANWKQPVPDNMTACIILLAAAVGAVIAGWKIPQRQIKILSGGIAAALFFAAVMQWPVISCCAPIVALGIASLIIPCGILVAVFKSGYRHRKVLTSCLIIGIIALSGQTADAKKYRKPVSQPYNAASPVITLVNYQLKVNKQENPDTTSGKYAVTAEVEITIEAEKTGTVSMDLQGMLLKKLDSVPEDVTIGDAGGRLLISLEKTGKKVCRLEFAVPLHKYREIYRIFLNVPSCKNEITISVGDDKLRVRSPNAISENGKTGQMQFVYAPDTKACLLLVPISRNRRDEKPMYYASVNTGCIFERDRIEVQSRVNLNVVRGQIETFKVKVPADLRVSSVTAKDLGLWRFDTATRTLTATFNRPQYGSVNVSMVCLRSRNAMPLEWLITPLRIEGATRQSNSIGLYSDNEVQLLASAQKSCGEINNDGFILGRKLKYCILKKAFRCFNDKAEIKVSAKAVKPELRLTEYSTIVIDDEKITLSSKMFLEISRTGIFSVALNLPAGFEISNLQCKSIRDWDEVTRDGKRQAILNFRDQMLGPVELHIELTKMVKIDFAKPLDTPGIYIPGTVRTTGTLAINVERGVTVNVLSRTGIAPESSTSIAKIRSTLSSFKILQPDWKLKLGFNVTAPWIQSETLYTVKLADGAATCSAVINYTIENSGVKRFRVRLPAGAETPEFSGKGVAEANLDKNGDWNVELFNKVMKKYRLDVRFRLPLGKGDFLLQPIVPLDSAAGTCYILVSSKDAVQLREKELKGAASAFSQRQIPHNFGTQPASDAVLCYRTVGSDGRILLELIRHRAAAQLDAVISNLTLESLAVEGQLINRATIQVANSNERFLWLKLPAKSDLWTAFVDDMAIEAGCDKDQVLIPLKQGISRRRSQKVVILYASPESAMFKNGKMSYLGPELKLPVRNLQWKLFLSERYSCSDFTGTLEFKRIETARGKEEVHLKSYDTNWSEARDKNRNMVQAMMRKAAGYAKSGRRQQAFETYNNALQMSGSNQADIKGQILLEQRKGNIKAMTQRRRSVGKRFAPSKSKEISQQEIVQLNRISDRISEQQQAAVNQAMPLSISVPFGGQCLVFERALLRGNTPVTVQFKATTSDWSKYLATGFIYLIIFVAGVVLTLLCCGRSAKQD